VINPKAAKATGLYVPPAMLAHAIEKSSVLLRCMSPVVALNDRYCGAGECPMLGATRTGKCTAFSWVPMHGREEQSAKEK
jgi:hypothetical protein